MNSMLALFYSFGPIATLIAACLLRAVAAAQPESPWTGARRRVLISISFVLTAVSFAGMLFLTFTVGALGVVGLLMSVFLVFLMADAELRVAGTRRRARQVELVWLLAIAVKSGRPLANEIDRQSGAPAPTTPACSRSATAPAAPHL